MTEEISVVSNRPHWWQPKTIYWTRTTQPCSTTMTPEQQIQTFLPQSKTCILHHTVCGILHLSILFDNTF